ncbi:MULTISPECIES: ATP-dependent DNA ligase [Subtercola]|uniref:ATP-dependent DNA ligase n=1 Tax=Subtercola vilae TaxID=2056433 RepID=A0A4T2C1V0_9MICO|nr:MULTISPECIES: ATP-dependent DNA ligase [Subtercola]MEA9984173.1 ATP-dependent DNA ligase [Subtercola sp. RTI3]TIH37442.1 ATP-dependent DNA ligase [Subtercola vilae]
MGTLTYGPAAKPISIDDRDLAHLQAVILTKLRRGESFSFTWERSSDLSSGHNTLWMHPHMFVEFSYYGSKRIPLNRAWIEAMMNRANSAGGLELIAEKLAQAPA